MLIAIDGPSGVGKSTVGQGVAAALRASYLDTGAFYRAATLAVLRASVDLTDVGAVTTTVAAVDLDFRDGRMFIDGEDVSAAIRAPDVTAAVSAVSAIPALREEIVARQRRWVTSRRGDAVVEGRDIGTVVFPEAPLKVFLTADPEIRASRRASDAEVAGRDLEGIADELQRRDQADSTRGASPLRVADDAHVIDTSSQSADDVIRRILELIPDR
ncbi:MAG: (d)CMP kinase [Acidimicrobiia bacterium]